MSRRKGKEVLLEGKKFKKQISKKGMGQEGYGYGSSNMGNGPYMGQTFSMAPIFYTHKPFRASTKNFETEIAAGSKRRRRDN